MDEELYKKLDELFKLLDDNEYIKNINYIKKNIDYNTLSLINNYRNNPNLENKKKLYNNELISKYLKNEVELNYLIMGINNKFRRRGKCAHN